MSDAYATPESQVADVMETEFPGMRRLPYFLWSIAVQIGGTILMAALAALEPAMAIILGYAVMLGGYFYLAAKRFQNIGDPSWWWLLLIIPIANIYFGLRALAYPEGYAEHRTFDTAAKVIIGLFVGVIVLGIGGAILLPVLAA